MLFALVGSSCRENGGKFIEEGEIHYNIDYVGSFGSIPKEALPRNLVVSFKKDKILFEMTGIGNSGIINLMNPEKEIFVVLPKKGFLYNHIFLNHVLYIF